MEGEEVIRLSPELEKALDNATPEQLARMFDLGFGIDPGMGEIVALPPGFALCVPGPQELQELSGTFQILMQAAANPYAIPEVA